MFNYPEYMWLEAIRQPIPPPGLEDLALEYHAIVHSYARLPLEEVKFQTSKRVDIVAYFSPDEAEHQLISLVLKHNKHTFADTDHRIVMDFYLTRMLIDNRHIALNEIRMEMIIRTLQGRTY